MRLPITWDKDGRVTFGKLEGVVQTLIVLSLLAFALETLPTISDFQRAVLKAYEVGTVAVCVENPLP